MHFNSTIRLLCVCLLLLAASCQLSTSSSEQDGPMVDEEGNPMVYDPASTKTNKKIPEGTINLLDLKGNKSRDGTQTYLDAENNPFSGIAIQLSRGKTDSYLEYTMEDGKMIRLRGFYDGGNLERDFPFKQGVSHGTLTMYHENGNKSVEEEFDQGKLSGSAKRWYENGKIWRDATFKKGKIVAEVFYNQDGSKQRK